MNANIIAGEPRDVRAVGCADAAERDQAVLQLERYAHDLREVLRSRDAAFGQLQAYVEDLRQALRQKDEALALARAAESAKARFLANMSHEFRTPLATILGFSEYALRRTKSGEERDLLGRIVRAGQRMDGMVEQLLTISRMAAEDIEVERAPIDLNALIGALEQRYRPLAEEKGLVLLAEPAAAPARLETDGGRLEQLLGCLLDNAVKFTDHGEVTLRVPAGGPSAPMRIEVTDTGIGIAEEDLSRIFAPFDRADASPARDHRGAGVGLTIAQSIARVLGCRIDCTSQPGRGSTFAVIFA